MRLRSQAGAAGWLGAGLSLAVLLGLAGRALGGDFPPGFNPENFEVRTYAPNSTREIADCKVERIFLDHRRLGFFKVRLLPVLVVQGIRVEFGDVNPTDEWAKPFESGWLPKVERRGVEWRDVGVGSQKPGTPSLHAGSAQPADAGATAVCVFKDVMLEANGATWRLPQAELRAEDGRPRLVWKDGGGERRMDLFSGKMFYKNSTSDGGMK